MSTGICGKRLAFEEVFLSASPSSQASPPSAKRPRCSPGHYSSPVPDLSFGPQEKLAVLLAMFSSADPEVVENILTAHDHKIDDAFRSLRALCLRDVSNGNTDPNAVDSCGFHHGEGESVASENTHVKPSDLDSDVQSAPPDVSSWVDTFVQEIMNASKRDDVRARVTKLLEMFEKNTITNCKAVKEQEFAVLQDQLQCLLRENRILKRAVVIQHERNLENDSKLLELQQLKLKINQYQEQVRTLELDNYTLRVRLQRAHSASSFPYQYHPDVF